MAFTFPDPNLTPEFEGDNGITYQWDDVDDKWVVKGFSNDGDYVKRAGDSMDGDLTMNYSDINLDAGEIIFKPIVPDGNPDGDQPGRWNRIASRRVRDKDNNLVTGSNDFGIRVDLTEGRTGYNKFEFFANVDGSSTGSKFADFGGGNNPTFRFRRGNFQMEGNRIQKLGSAEVDTDAVSYGQVKDELKDFKSEIIEQAAIGIFKWDTQSSNTTPSTGCFFGKQDANNATEPFINNFRVSNEDINGANQDFSTWAVGDIITWTNIINSAYQIRYRVNTVPTFQNGHYFFEVQYISQTNLFVQGNDFILTRQQFTNIDFGDLETTYLRLDCDNSPLVTSQGLEIKTDSDAGGGFGEASLTLNGKRDNKNNSVASIKFKNWNYDDSDTVNGYITYRTVDSADGYFRFSKDVELNSRDLLQVSNLKLTNPGSIWSDTNERIKFKTATAAENGDGIVEFTRPGTNSRRGITIRGKDTSNADNDIFYTYTNSSGGDAINYLGRQTDNSSNLATTKYVKNYVDNNVTSGATNITISRNTTSATVQSSTGTNGTINSASSSYAGVMTSADKSKLDGMGYKIVYRSGNYFIEGA